MFPGGPIQGLAPFVFFFIFEVFFLVNFFFVVFLICFFCFYFCFLDFSFLGGLPIHKSREVAIVLGSDTLLFIILNLSSSI